MADPRIPLFVTGWQCDRHGLGFDNLEAAQEHATATGCRWAPDGVRVKTLAELQAQMDVANADLAEAEAGVDYARQAISAASSRHADARRTRDAAKLRADAARRLWAERAQHLAGEILEEPVAS